MTHPHTKFPSFEIPKLIFTQEGDYGDFLTKIEQTPTIFVLAGKKGSGKTATGFRFMENLSSVIKKKCFAVGFPDGYLPESIAIVEEIDYVENDSIVLIDEAGSKYNSRKAMRSTNMGIMEVVQKSRQKKLWLILITQSTASIDVEVLRNSDVILMKETSKIQSRFERPSTRPLTTKSRGHIQHHEKSLPTQVESLLYIFSHEFEGLVKVSLPSFWKEEISYAYGNQTGKQDSNK